MYKKFTFVLILFGMMLMSLSMRSQDQAKGETENWRLGVQAWSFNRFTFYEAVDKTASLGLKYIEAYPGQKLSKDNPNIVFGPDMPAEIKQQVKQKLKDAGVKLVNFGVVKLPDDETGCRKVFDFAKEMGIETIAAEPPEEAFDMLDKLCQEYKISVAIHNHPPTTHYWDPNTVLKVCNGRSKWIGACVDIGHWMRSGVNPLEALKKLQGRIIAVHLKDLNEFGNLKAHDVPWGTGKADVKALLAELDRQNFRGVFSIEYEYNWENSVPEIRQCVAYFNKVAGELKSKRAGETY
jgi:sugar phosphate isomerase/epimerase